MDRIIENIPAILGVLVSILSILKSVGFFEMKNRRIERIEKLCTIHMQLGRSVELAGSNIENILVYETEKLNRNMNRNFDFGGLFAMIFISIIMGVLTYFVVIWFLSISYGDLLGWLTKIFSGVVLFFVAMVDVAIIVAGQDTIFKRREEK